MVFLLSASLCATNVEKLCIQRWFPVVNSQHHLAGLEYALQAKPDMGLVTQRTLCETWGSLRLTLG